MKTITIVENDDGTEKIYMHNMGGRNEEIIIDKAKIKFNMNYENIEYPCIKKCDIDFTIHCLPYNDKLFTVNPYKCKMTNGELINELESRLSK